MFLLLSLALVDLPVSPVTPGASNTHFSYTLTTTAPAAAIWAIWSDVANWHTWDTGLKSAALAGPFAVGTRGRLVPDSGPSSAFELTAVDPGRSYTFRTRLPLGALYVKRTLESGAGPTRFTHEVWFTGLSKPLFGRVLGKKYRALLPSVLEAIRAQAEQ